MKWSRGRVVGRGSSATVSIATTRCSGEVLAVKSAESSQSKPLQREQSILSTLNHPHIIRYIGCDTTIEHGKAMFDLVMEYASQGTIIDSLMTNRSQARFDESLIGHYTHQIVKGLEYLHSRNIVHGDIKGSNILLSSRNEVKIADFGCAKVVNEQGVIGGTPMFMAPEVLIGAEQSFQADIWALGCTVIEMCTGNPPWPECTICKIALFCSELPKFPSFLSDSGKDFLDKCLRIDPKERWAAKELLQHPFLSELDFLHSPTSVLDRGIWSSDEEEKEELNETVHVGSTLSSSLKRIRDLVKDSRNESCEWEDNGWILIRDSEKDKFSNFSSSNNNRNGFRKKRNLEFTACKNWKRHRNELATNEFQLL